MLGSLLRDLLKPKRAQPTPAGADWRHEAAALRTAGRHAEAAAVCHAQLAIEPEAIEVREALAAALLAQGQARDALRVLLQAAERAPQKPELHVHLGLVHSATGDLKAALESYRRALALRPALTDARLSAITLLGSEGRYEEAEDLCREGLALDRSSNALQHALAGVLFEQGRVSEAIAALRAVLAREPANATAHSDLVRALNYAGDVQPIDIFRESRAWGERHAAPLIRLAAPHTNVRDPDRRLRIGYVSPYFRKHAVTFFLESVIEHYDRAAFDIVLYADVARPDEYSERLRGYGAQWCSTVDLTDEEVAEKVRSDGIDILVDLSGHTPRHRLLAFARRPAPVQVTWNGYPNTTGMEAMDYRITDALCDPPGKTEALHTEALVRLPHIYMAWRPPADAPEPALAPKASNRPLLFGSFNSCFKITPATIALWARVLERLPRSALRLLAVPGGRAEARIRSGFAGHGIGAERLEFLPRLTHEAFLEAHHGVDIALDTWPYHGTTTTCFSLWMGVPVIARVGEAHVSRVGLTLLSSIGLGHLAAPDADAYVDTAVRLAANPGELAALRSGLRERIRQSPLTDGAACARAMEDAYRRMWRTWCSARS